jgi:predicted DNA-binding transcriptional regulator YafY
MLRKKLVSFLNQDKMIEKYISSHKPEKTSALHKAIKDKRQVLLMNYYSGNSETVRNRLVEPFEFKDDFNLVWAFDVELKQNRQFKISRIENVVETPLAWEYHHLHRAKPVDIFRNTGDLNKEIEIIVNIRARNLLIEEYPLAERYLEMIKGNRFRLKVMVAKYEGPGRFVMGLFENIEVIGGEGFRNFLMMKKEKL